MRALVVGAVMLVVCVAGLTACGDSGPTAEEKREAAERREKAEVRQAEESAQSREAECGEQLEPFISALEGLDARLEVGLNFEEYFDELGNIQVAYNQLPIDDLHPRCLGRVGVPSEKAYQAFTAAGEDWDACIEALSCGDEISPEVQRQWVRGSRLLEEATGLGMTEVGAVAAGDFKSGEFPPKYFD